MTNNLLTIPYKLARLPIGLVDERVTERLPEGSAPRTAIDRALGSADKLAGSLLRDPDLAARGAERIERSERLAAAAHLEAEAEALREDAQDRASAGLQDADEIEERRSAQAREAADQEAERKKAAAAKRAEARRADAEKRKQREQEAAEATKQSAQDDAKQRLEDAAQTTRSARSKKVDAEQLEELADAKAEQRRKR